MHFDPETGADRSVDEPGRERCVRACYDCLLSYGNQRVHEMIDRHLVCDLVLRLATATVSRPAAATLDRPEAGEPQNSRAAEFLAWLRAHDLRLPDEMDREAEGVRPDLIYRLPDGNAAVFVKGTGEGNEEREGRDERAQDVLRDLGWSVIIIGAGADWAAVAARYPSVFGTQ